MKIKKLCLPILLLFIPTGCLHSTVIDDIRLVQAIGYDYVGDDLVLSTVAVPNYTMGGGESGGGPSSSATTDSFSVISHTGKAIPTKMQTKAQQPLKLGKVNTILFDEDLAKHGIDDFVDYLNRDPVIGRKLYLAVVDGSTQELLSGQYEESQAVSIYLNDLIKQNIKYNLPRMNLHEFLYSYFGQGKDPILPILKKSGDHIEITGIALFRNGKYVGKIPIPNKTFIFKLMSQPFEGGAYEFYLKNNPSAYISVLNTGSKVTYSVKNGNSASPDILIHVKMKAIITEAPLRSNPKEYINKISKAMEKDIEKQGEQLVEKFQKMSVDPLGLGAKTRSQTRGWDFEKWKDHYPNADVKLKVDIQVKQTGITE
ncbi:spore germination protein [Scopulibacillus darangshiensis]|uniref:Spore germination protein n=1 Tax=Scopulibacillus darangshiensis TaxID=442528 RepID=A0A4R2NYC1_9BACL|nr:Ger(x)C family spore germination protein [Scopulibacillus darangshiensis]TCP26624.1 spore germination protein [Scopulibacillus darangshiensis]